MRLLTKLPYFFNHSCKFRTFNFDRQILTRSTIATFRMGHCNGNGFYATSAHSPPLKPDKVSYLSVPGKYPLLGLTIGQLIDLSVERYGNSHGLIVSDLNIYKTFAQLKQEIDALAAGFLSLGFTKGDRIGIWGPNSYEYYLTQMACWKAGLVLVNINSAYQAPELLFCLQNVNIHCLVIAPNFKTQDFYAMVTEVVPEIPSSKPGKIRSSAVPEFTTLITMGEDHKNGAFTLKEVLRRGESNDSKILLGGILPTVQFDDVCNIQFTSGTTGNPKGAMLTHHNIINNSFFIGQRFQFSPNDRICLTVPLFHCYGSVIGTLVGLHYGSAIVIPAAAFSGQASIQAAAKERCTVMYGTPTMHIAMMNAPDFENHDLSSLRLACTAGAICPEELIREMKTKYTVETVGSLYGMTETSPVSFTSLPEDCDTLRAETVGYPMEHCEVKVVDTDGKIVPLGTPGELCTRGYVTMSGYYGDKEKTEMIFKPTKWLHTGDLVVMRESGHASIVGRIKDTIIRGGENIYPKEIEEFLHTNLAILEAQVFGIPDYRMGEEVAAWILLKDGVTLSEDQVKTFCKGKIAHYKVPRHIFFVTEFPKTVSGKLQKHKMREETIKRMQGAPQPG